MIIYNAFMMAIVTVFSCYLLWIKFPNWLKKFLLKHSLFTDLSLFVITYVVFGGTVTALFAAAFCGIFISILLQIANNKEQFGFIYKLIDTISNKTKNLVNK